MKKILLALFLLGPPLQAQHRSSPGTPGGVAIPITVNGQCQVVTAGGTNSAMFAVTGTWTGTLGFFGTNDLGVATVALQAYPVNTTTGALGSSSVNTTTGNGVWIADTFGMYQAEICATAAMTGSALIRIDADPAVAVMQVTGVGGAAIPVTGSLSVSGAADVVSAGAPTTFNANTICTGSLLTAGLQSAGFHLDAGTLTGTFTAQCSAFTSGTTNFTNGGLKDVTGATVSGAVTNPNAQTDWTITCPGDTRRVQVCTTAFTSGSATGQAVGTFYQTASAAGGGGGGPATQSTAGTNAQAWWVRIGDATNGPVAVKAPSTAAVATDSALVCAISPNNTVALPANQSMNESQINGVAPLMGNGASGTGAQRVTIANDSTGQVAIAGTASVTATGGAAGAASGPVYSVQWPDATGSGNPASVATFGANTVATTTPPSFAAATNLTTACSTATACSPVTGSIQWAVSGQNGAEFVVTAIASPVGFALACDTGYDNNATYLLGDCAFNQAGVFKKTLANADLTAGNKFTLSWLGSPSFVRVRVTAVTSGQFTAAGVASTASSLPWPVEAKVPSQNAVTLTASTAETTLLAAGGSGVFLDLTELTCSTSSATGNVITLRPATGATCPGTSGCRTIICPASTSGSMCDGWVWKTPWAQNTSNANWTVQASASTTSVFCEVQAVQR